ncbi:MAG: pilus assembly PilX N-terminal domain-containing protein [Phycisphaerae bacterium]|nr:pilus assembly PilX N-terminal domain-containing protein [Phycisphaerae bacterium]
MKLKAKTSGSALVISIMLVSLITALAMALMINSSTSIAMANNYRHVQTAMFQAESGLSYFTYRLRRVTIAPGLRGAPLLEALHTALTNDLLQQVSPILEGTETGYEGAVLTIPEVTTIGGDTFSGTLVMTSSDTARLTVYGQARTEQSAVGPAVQRSISIDFAVADVPGPAFDYGLFVGGPIHIGLGLNLLGLNDSEEASIYTGASGEALTVEGGHIDGNVIIADADATTNINATVGGEVRRGGGQLALPRIDTSVFAPLATTVVDGTTDVSSGSFTNIRIPAGTNPSFGDVTIQGVVYIEAPNVVSFANNVDITGVIVTEDPGEAASPADHRIIFNSNATVRSVEELPDTAEFAELRGMTGTAILAPGFELEFKNNFDIVGGTIAADSMTLINNLTAVLRGSVIIYGPTGFDMKNNAHLTVNHAAVPGIPAGFLPLATALTPVPDSYVEN